VLNIFGELEAAEIDFVSICRLIERIAIISSHESPERPVDVPTICKWLLKRISESEKPLPCLRVLTSYYAIEVKFPNDPIERDREWVIQKLSSIIGMKKLPLKQDENADTDDWFDETVHISGFLRSEIEEFIPELVKIIKFPPLQEGNVEMNLVSMETKYSATPVFNASETEDIPEQSCEWGNFKGKDTALMMIAGMAIALSKSGESFKRSGEINVSAVVRAAAQAINRYGAGVDVTEKALHNLVRDALKQHISKIDP